MIVSDAARSRGDIMHRLAELERAVRELSAARRLEASSVGDGGTVIDGGHLIVLHANGNEIVRVGKLVWTAGGLPVHGVEMRRTEGTLAFTVVSPEKTGLASYAAFVDRRGTIVVSDDGVTGQGMATPYLNCGPFNLAVNNDTLSLLPKTASGSFVGLWEGDLPLSHPKLHYRIYFDRDDGASTGEGRIMLNGSQIGTTASIGTGGVHHEETVSVPGWGSTVDYLQKATMTIEVRRLTGTGKILAVPYALYGQQS